MSPDYTLFSESSAVGFKVSVEQTKEVVDFWNKCSGEILSIIKVRFR